MKVVRNVSFIHRAKQRGPNLSSSRVSPQHQQQRGKAEEIIIHKTGYRTLTKTLVKNIGITPRLGRLRGHKSRTFEFAFCFSQYQIRQLKMSV